MPRQQPITGFLWFPLEVGSSYNDSQSHRVPGDSQVSDAAANTRVTGQSLLVDSSSSAHDPPQRTHPIRPKRAERATKKIERKRAELHRQCKTKCKTKCKTNRDSVPEKPATSSDQSSVKQSCPGSSSDQAPASGPSSGQTDDTSDADLSMLSERSLSDMLASAFSSTGESEPSTRDSQTLSTQAGGPSEDNMQTIQLESQLLAARIQMECATDEKSRLINQVQILETEIDKYKKTQHNLKSQVKKLTTTNDNLMREISRYRGMRQFTDVSNNNTRDCTSMADDGEKDRLHEQLGVEKAKLTSLREHMVSLASSMLSTLEGVDDDAVAADSVGFTLVTRDRRRRSAAPALQSSAPATSYHSQNAGQRIEVITNVGKAIDDTHTGPVPSSSWSLHGQNEAPLQQQRRPQYQQSQHNYWHGASRREQYQQQQLTGNPPPHPTNHDVTTQQQRLPTRPNPRSSPEVIIIGTSLTRGVSGRLRDHGIDATSYTYAGTQIPHIRGRISNIITPTYQPKKIVLQCGGNDLESQSVDRVAHQYNCLVRELKTLCPSALIVVSKIAPRRGKASIIRKITAMNTHLENMSQSHSSIHCIDVCPTSIEHFRKDMVHFNNNGTQLYAANLASALQNFPRTQSREHQ